MASVSTSLSLDDGRRSCDQSSTRTYKEMRKDSRSIGMSLGEEDGGTLPLSAPSLSSEYLHSLYLRRHQKNFTGVVDQVVWDHRSRVNNLEAVTLVEPDRSLVLLEDQQA